MEYKEFLSSHFNRCVVFSLIALTAAIILPSIGILCGYTIGEEDLFLAPGVNDTSANGTITEKGVSQVTGTGTVQTTDSTDNATVVGVVDALPCQGGPKWCQDADEMYDIIYRHQHPPDCSKAKFLIAQEWANGGLGSLITVKSRYLAFAMNEGRVLIILPNEGSHVEWSQCPLNSLECFFLPITSCTADHTTPANSIRNPDAIVEAPLAALNKTYGHMWWRTIAIKFLMRPNVAVQTFMQEYRKSMRLGSPYAVIHIRRTDKVGEMKLVSTETYINYLIALKNETGVRNVMVLTDDLEVFREVEPYKGQFEFSIHSGICARAIRVDYRLEHMKYNCSMVTLSELYIAGEGDYFIGTFRSNFSYLINSFQRLNRRRTFQGIDVAGVPESCNLPPSCRR